MPSPQADPAADRPLRRRRLFASALLLLWLALLGLITGPLRWEFAHSYAHWIAGLGDTLPLPTYYLGLPLLGLPSPGGSIWTGAPVWPAVLCGLIAWAGPLLLLLGVWRAPSRLALLEWLLLAGGAYALALLAIGLGALFSLWLPFGLLAV
jgi:hypothetical protein